MSRPAIPDVEMLPRVGTEPTPPEERLLGPEESVQINTDQPIAGSEEMRQKIGLAGKLVANINAGSKDLLLVDVREAGLEQAFYVVDETYSPSRRKGYQGIVRGKPETFGTNHHEDKLTYPGTTSRDHFEVAYVGNALFIRNLNPTNETRVTASFVPEPGREELEVIHNVMNVMARRTIGAQERVRYSSNYDKQDDAAPHGYYMKHPILGRKSTSVMDGVYLGGSAREATVVNGKSKTLKNVYKGLSKEITGAFKKDETLPTEAILLMVMQKVQEVMPYDDRKTEALSRKYHGDKLVGLSKFVKEGAGVCRHQGLLAAYLIERLIKDGHMMGGVGVERNTVSDMGGTHAWAVYKPQRGGTESTIVVDPAQSFIGSKQQAQREGRWEYRLPVED